MTVLEEAGFHCETEIIDLFAVLSIIILIADLFLYSYEAEFIQKLLHEKKKKSLAVTFSSTFRYRYIDISFCLFVDSLTSNFSVICRLSPLTVTGLVI
jgi:hypothetical protein